MSSHGGGCLRCPMSCRCPRCGRNVLPSDERPFGGQIYHTFCFSCCGCRRPLNERTACLNQGEIYCIDCCQGCSTCMRCCCSRRRVPRRRPHHCRRHHCIPVCYPPPCTCSCPRSTPPKCYPRICCQPPSSHCKRRPSPVRCNCSKWHPISCPSMLTPKSPIRCSPRRRCRSTPICGNYMPYPSASHCSSFLFKRYCKSRSCSPPFRYCYSLPCGTSNLRAISCPQGAALVCCGSGNGKYQGGCCDGGGGCCIRKRNPKHRRQSNSGYRSSSISQRPSTTSQWQTDTSSIIDAPDRPLSSSSFTSQPNANCPPCCPRSKTVNKCLKSPPPSSQSKSPPSDIRSSSPSSGPSNHPSSYSQTIQPYLSPPQTCSARNQTYHQPTSQRSKTPYPTYDYSSYYPPPNCYSPAPTPPFNVSQNPSYDKCLDNPPSDNPSFSQFPANEEKKRYKCCRFSKDPPTVCCPSNFQPNDYNIPPNQNFENYDQRCRTPYPPCRPCPPPPCAAPPCAPPPCYPCPPPPFEKRPSRRGYRECRPACPPRACCLGDVSPKGQCCTCSNCCSCTSNISTGSESDSGCSWCSGDDGCPRKKAKNLYRSCSQPDLGMDAPSPREITNYYNREHSPNISRSNHYQSCLPQIKPVSITLKAICNVRCPGWVGGGDTCTRCGRLVYHAEKIKIGNCVFHPSCFTCACCRKALDTISANQTNQDVYCKQCYLRNFGPLGYGYRGALLSYH